MRKKLIFVVSLVALGAALVGSCVSKVWQAQAQAIEIQPKALSLTFVYADGTPVKGTLEFTVQREHDGWRFDSALPLDSCGTVVIPVLPVPNPDNQALHTWSRLLNENGSEVWRWTMRVSDAEFFFQHIRSGELKIVVQ